MMLQWPLVEIGKLLLLWFVYAMKETMKAVALTRYLPINDPESLQDFELPKPVPGKRDLLVRIESVSVNPVDVKVRAPKPGIEVEPKILGWDAAGIVERVWRSELRSPHWEEPARSALFDLILKFYNKRYSVDRQWRPLHLPPKY